MVELDTKDREKLDKRKFAYVDKEGERHLPIAKGRKTKAKR
jgi:hypothetical protein